VAKISNMLQYCFYVTPDIRYVNILDLKDQLIFFYSGVIPSVNKLCLFKKNKLEEI